MSSVANDPTSNVDDCIPSGPLDVLQMDWVAVRVHNESLIRRYKNEGKITNAGFPTLNFVHITKVAGDAFQMASLPIHPYSMGYMNEALKSKVDVNALNCFFTQQPAIDLEHDIAEFVYGGSDIFCAMRNPYDKVASSGCHMLQYDLLHSQNVSKENVDRRIREGLERYVAGNRHTDTCFWVPQTDYLQGQFGCKHILDFDNIESEYSNLVHEFGFDDLSLPPANETHQCHQVCDFSKDDMSPETLRLVESLYAKDIAFWSDFKNAVQNESPRDWQSWRDWPSLRAE